MSSAGCVEFRTGLHSRDSRATMKGSPDRVLAHIRALHRSSRTINDHEIDTLLDIRPRESRLDPVALVLEHGNEQIDWYGGAPYETIREAIRRLAPVRGDVFYDLGSGYGRVVLWGAIVSDGLFRGIELVPERVAVAERVRRKLALRNLELRQGNVRSAALDDGNLFFLFDPFFADTLRLVGRRLADVAHRHPIRIASLWGTGRFFVRRRWLAK